MKKVVLIAAAFMLTVLIFTGCGNVANAKIDIGKSEAYTEDERNKVANEIKDIFFKNYDECTLHTIKYSGDKMSEYELDYCRELIGKDYKECIAFETEFRSPDRYRDDQAWNLNEEYSYHWYFARENGGEWEYITAGQG